MTPQHTLYVTQTNGCKIQDKNGNRAGKVLDINVNTAPKFIVYKDVFCQLKDGIQARTNRELRLMTISRVEDQARKIAHLSARKS